jgi:RNase H-like domain found in reverse transcriptase
MLSRPRPDEILFLYLAATRGTVSAALVREDAEGQRLVYYVSRILRDADTRYPPIEKPAFALIVASQKFRSYFQAHTIRVLTKEPLKKALGCFDTLGITEMSYEIIRI